MLFGIEIDRKPGKLTEADVLLAEALRLYEAGLCPDCRHPTAWMFNPRLERFLYYAEDEAVCNYCALVQTRQSDQDNPMQPGEKVVIENNIFDALTASHEAERG